MLVCFYDRRTKFPSRAKVKSKFFCQNKMVPALKIIRGGCAIYDIKLFKTPQREMTASRL